MFRGGVGMCIPGLLPVAGSLICSESEGDLRVMITRFVEACEMKYLNVNTG